MASGVVSYGWRIEVLTGLAKYLGLPMSPYFEQLRSLQLLKIGRKTMAKRATPYASGYPGLAYCPRETLQRAF